MDWSIDLPLATGSLIKGGLGLTFIILGGALLGGICGSFVGAHLSMGALYGAPPGAAIGASFFSVLQSVFHSLAIGRRYSPEEKKISNAVACGATLGAVLGVVVCSASGAAISVANVVTDDALVERVERLD